MSDAVVTYPIKIARLSLGRKVSALAALLRLSLRQNVRGRRSLVLLALFALPCVLAIILRNSSKPTSSESLEFWLVFNLIPHALAPITALLYSSGIVQDEVEEQTLTYLLMRPLPRWAMYVTKWASSFVVGVAIIAAFTFALYSSIHIGESDPWGDNWLTRATLVAGIFVLTQFTYSCLFGLIGLLTRRSLVAGVIYIAAIEGILANFDFVARELTVVYYFRVLSLRWLSVPTEVVEQWKTEWKLQIDKLPSADVCVWVLLIAGVVFTAASALIFQRKEFHVKTPESGG